MWLVYALLALLAWSGSDLFSKIGCTDKSDKMSPLKMVTAVGLVMGLHAAYEIFIVGTEINWNIILTYLPVSFLYIGSMAIGYLGLRYIELSVSSPICNSSGALVAILTFITAGVAADLPALAIPAVILVSLGVIGLGVTEAREDEGLRAARQEKSNFKYVKSIWAILIPVIYCLLDALGTFADSIVLQSIPDENSANVAYELTFFLAGLVAFIYVKFVKKEKYLPKFEGPKYIAAVFETIGQVFYIRALAQTEYVAFAAPIISAYCVASVLWGRIFLKEKLSWKHYFCIGMVVVGIIIMGILDM